MQSSCTTSSRRARGIWHRRPAPARAAVARDPTLELLKLLERWQPCASPTACTTSGSMREGERALLIAETARAGIRSGGQRAALAALRAAFAAVDGAGPHAADVSGPGRFSVLMEARTRGEAQTLGALATVGMILLLFVAYRRLGSVLSQRAATGERRHRGTAAVSALFGAVHGITLAFGFTLIGVAQDYPMHLLSHEQPGRPPLQIARELWPTLATGVASTCIAYATFLFSGVDGLAQLACFTVAALAAAALTTRFLLPRADGQRHARFRRVGLARTAVAARRQACRVRVGLLVALAGIALRVVALAPGPMWENDLSKLTPVPRSVAQRDQELRDSSARPTCATCWSSRPDDRGGCAAQLERLDGELRESVQRGVIARLRPRCALPTDRATGRCSDSADCRTRRRCATHSTRRWQAHRFAPTSSSLSSATSSTHAHCRR